MSSNSLLPLLGTPNFSAPLAPKAISAALVNIVDTSVKITFTLSLERINEVTQVMVRSFPDEATYTYDVANAHLDLVTGNGYVIIAALPLRNQNYKFTVSAVNLYGIGQASNYSNTITTPSGIPPATNAPVATKVGATSAKVAFTGIANQTLYQVTRYTVYSNPPTTTKTIDITSSNTATSFSVQFDNLTRGIFYSFYTIVKNSIGSGPASGMSNTIQASPYGVPEAPGSVTAIGGEEQVTITWSPTTNDNGRPVTNYSVILTNGDHFYSYNPGGPFLSATINSVAPGSGYVATVSAINSFGIGDPKSSNSVTVTVIPPRGTVNFATNGTFTVPNDTTQIAVLAIGAGGNGSSDWSGGGGQSYAQLCTVSPGDIVNVQVGQPETTDTVLTLNGNPLLTVKSGKGKLYGGRWNQGNSSWYRGGAPVQGPGIAGATAYGGDGFGGIGGGGGAGFNYQDLGGLVRTGKPALNTSFTFSGTQSQQAVIYYTDLKYTNWNPADYGYTYDFSASRMTDGAYIVGIPNVTSVNVTGQSGTQSSGYFNIYYYANGSNTVLSCVYYYNNTDNSAYQSSSGSMGQGGNGGIGAGGGAGPSGGSGGPGYVIIWYGRDIPSQFFPGGPVFG